MMPMVLNSIILILGAGFLFQPLNGSPALIAAIKNGDESAEKLAATFDPRAVPLYYSECGTGWNDYWETRFNRYKVTVLDLALLYGRKNAAIILINRGADISTQGEFGNTPLHIAAGRGLDTVVRELLKNIKMTKPQAIDLQNKDCKTPLHFAADYEWEDVIKTLLVGGANPNIVDNFGYTPLHLAIQRNLSGQTIIDIIEAMKAKAVDDLDHNEITNPSEYSSGTMVHDGLDPNTIGEATSKIMNLSDNEGRTAFWMAVRHQRGDIANILFKNGADPTKSDNSGDSPFHTSLPTDMTDEMIILMIKNIDVNHVDIFGKNLLQYAFEDRREVLIKHLLERGATTIIPDRDGNTALHLAIMFELSDQIFIDIIKAASPKPIHLVLQNKMTSRFFRDLSDKLHENLPREVVRNILALSCDAIINSKRRDGQTACCLAANNNRVDIAQILVENGADPTIADYSGNTPIYGLLFELSDDSFLSIIRNFDINHLSNDGSTIFHCVIKCDREVLVMNLLKRGANPSIADRYGNTALHLAILHNLSSETIISILEVATPRPADVLGQNGIAVYLNWKLSNAPLDPNVNRQSTSKIINFRNQFCQTALFLAFSHDRLDIAQILMDRGADPNIPDSHGEYWTPETAPGDTS